MGKGKGNFIRWVFRVRRGFVLSEFLGISKYRLSKVLIKISKKLKLKLSLVKKSPINDITVQ